LLLTKVTPGVGVVWFGVRREWRNLAVALGVTAAVAALSFAFAPGAWFEWFGILREGAQMEPGGIPVPVTVRAPIAALLVVIAARRDWRWLLAVAVMLAMPQVGWSATPMRFRPD
jgi:hypothetical protein